MAWSLIGAGLTVDGLGRRARSAFQPAIGGAKVRCVRCNNHVAMHNIFAYMSVWIVGQATGIAGMSWRAIHQITSDRKVPAMSTKTTKTTKTTGKTPFETFDFPAPAFELPVAFRELAEQAVSQVRETYAKIKSAAEEATDLAESTIETAREGAFAWGVKAIDAARSNADASFTLARDLFGAKTVSDVIELQSAFVRKQFEAGTAQFKELQQLTEKVITDTTKPVTQKVEKTLKDLKAA